MWTSTLSSISGLQITCLFPKIKFILQRWKSVSHPELCKLALQTACQHSKALTLKGTYLFKCLSYYMFFLNLFTLFPCLLLPLLLLCSYPKSYSHLRTTLSLTPHKSLLWPCHHMFPGPHLTWWGRRRQISGFFLLNHSVNFLSGKADVNNETQKMMLLMVKSENVVNGKPQDNHLWESLQ